ncbi:L,D-transpeptidase family protein [Hyphomicrobium sp. D-2]|uniref:L,D-transpeptidase family protein n=1 Tax=Hyphomicrobium sp. D-2 TaxID=3041621 RepID=UPI002453BBAC|nr:L,D-transpeptidase family protein [Hyphomicrobium sp. D-2]MDH4982113.1 L,D-transpeptidase family protein [Hyphomicrobium sp. D-2]
MSLKRWAALAGPVLVAGGVLAVSHAGAQEFLRFGPAGEGPSEARSGGYDRSFIREWQANPPKGYPTLNKANLEPTRKAVARYEQIVATGGFPLMPQVEVEPGMTDAAVSVLRRRLQRSGDLDAAETNYPEHYGSDLVTAVKRFQASNGLAPTGVVDRRTIAALNVPSEVRLAQLKTNLTRLNDLAGMVRKRYVMVNIPAAQIEAVENNAVAMRYSGVVGKPDRPTPLLRSTITDLAFNPPWTLPPTVIKEDLIPKGRDMQSKGQNVLVKYGIDAYEGGKKLDPESINWASNRPFQLTYRQIAGKENPLGFLKINFANSESVYMHDSPKESLFGRNFRAASSGCVRVQNIADLATWLLAGQGTAEQVDHLRESGETRTVRLRRPVPLYFAYVTAWATPDGVIQFRPDLYLKDGVGKVAAAY